MSKTINVLIKIQDEIKQFQDKGLPYNAARRLIFEKYKKELEVIRSAKKN